MRKSRTPKKALSVARSPRNLRIARYPRYPKYSRYHRQAAPLRLFAMAMLCLLFIVITARLVSGALFGVRIDIKDVREMKISAEEIASIVNISAEAGVDKAEVLTAYCIDNRFFTDKQTPKTEEQIRADFMPRLEKIKTAIGEKRFAAYLSVVEPLINETQIFPVPAEFGSRDYTFGDSWGARSGLCGAESHQGADIFDRENIGGRLSIAAMSGGIVVGIEKQKDGGVDITIKSESGSKQLYGGLFNTPEGIQEGAAVGAGEILGYVGSKDSGKKGSYPAGVHIGFCVNTELSGGDKGQLWVNPYPFLCYLESNAYATE